MSHSPQTYVWGGLARSIGRLGYGLSDDLRQRDTEGLADYVGVFDAHRGFAAKQAADFDLGVSGSPCKFSLVYLIFGGDTPQDSAHSCGKGLHDCQGYADFNLTSIISYFESNMQRCISRCWRIEGIDMTDTATRSRAQALAKLRETRGDLLCARVSALQVNLTGQRAQELTEKIADALAHAERLMFFVEGDGC
jgi:hypothetical protein